MKKVIAVCVAVVFATLLCQMAFSQATERPRRRPTGAAVGAARPAPLTEKQRAEFGKAMERMRELSQVLREVTAKARQSKSVTKAFEKVRAKQEELRALQQKANGALDAALAKEVKGKPDLQKALAERKKLQEKFQQLRGRFPGRTPGGFGARPGGTRRGTGAERRRRPEGASGAGGTRQPRRRSAE